MHIQTNKYLLTFEALFKLNKDHVLEGKVFIVDFENYLESFFI